MGQIFMLSINVLLSFPLYLWLCHGLHSPCSMCLCFVLFVTLSLYRIFFSVFNCSFVTLSFPAAPHLSVCKRHWLSVYRSAICVLSPLCFVLHFSVHPLHFSTGLLDNSFLPNSSRSLRFEGCLLLIAVQRAPDDLLSQLSLKDFNT